jgi:hypothetical protein
MESLTFSLNERPLCLQNGTWYHLSVHAAPHFVHVPKEIYYVNIGDSIILNCQVIVKEGHAL